MERIRNSGNSEALLALAKRISDTMKQRSSQPLSMNLSPNTVVERTSPGVSRMKFPILRNYSSDGYYSLQEIMAEREKREAELVERERNKVEISSMKDLKKASVETRVIEVLPNCCNEVETTVLDLSRFVNLQEFRVRDNCFENVNEVKLIGMKMLESVIVGENCFTKKEKGGSKDPIGHFYVKNCEKLRELKIGRCSFKNYSVCEIENVDSLEVIEMGESKRDSYTFFYTASLRLKSDCSVLRVMNRLTEFEITSIW